MAAPDAKPRRLVRNGGPGAAWSLPALAARAALAARRLGRGDWPGLLVDPGGADRHRPAPAGPGLPLGARALRTVHPGLRRHPFPVDLDPTHFLSIWTLWNPDYGLQGAVKAITAAVSLVTAIALWPLLPRVLALPSSATLADANAR